MDVPPTPLAVSQSLPSNSTPALRQISPAWSSCSSERLNEECRMVLSDLTRRLQVVSYDTLVRSALGSEPPASFRSLNRLKRKIHSVNNLLTQPSKSRSSETEAFKPLGSMIEEIFMQTSRSFFSYDSSPDTTAFLTRENTFRPDAYIKRREIKPMDVHWFDIAIPFGFKRTNNIAERLDNERKMMWSLHNIMREDPLRRFVFGITVEDTNMRLWLGNRAFLAVSESIDFIQDIDTAISLFHLIASHNDVGLGWDPTVQREWDQASGDAKYVFMIRNKRFTTIRPLATYGADSMVGRGTRVFLAEAEDGREVVIKDSWRDSERLSEGAILEEILQDVRKKLGEEARVAEKCFVAIDCFEDVFLAPGKLDRTVIPDNYIPNTFDVPDSMQSLPCERRTIPCRTHARTVFKDVGVPLQAVSSLTKSFLCLRDALQGLYYLHRAGWVHRDFSAANVLWVEVDEKHHVGKLGDLEYAKKVDSEISHEVRTGTMHFMAIEVEQQEYLFTPEPDLDFRKASSSTPPPPFRMNYLHDLESHWWAAMWILFFHVDKDSPPEDIDKQLQSFNQAFPSALETSSRQNFFKNGRRLLAGYETLSKTCTDGCAPVFSLAASLHQFYEEAEMSFPIIELDDNLVVEIHEKVRNTYAETVESLQKSKDIMLQPLCIAVQKRMPDNPFTEG